MKLQEHHFFLHDLANSCGAKTVGSSVTIVGALATRIASILRLRNGESCTLFSGASSITIELTSILSGKRASVTGIITHIEHRKPLTPSLTLLCGATKPATFEEICYTATQLGVTQLIPVITTKTYAKSYSEKDYERFNAHTIAAAEQSKQIILPRIEQPVAFEKLAIKATSAPTLKLMFEADGQPITSLITQKKPEQIIVAFGPEGGFTPAEQTTLAEAGFIKVRLCPSILRTQDAVEVGVGLLRCLW